MCLIDDLGCMFNSSMGFNGGLMDFGVDVWLWCGFGSQTSIITLLHGLCYFAKGKDPIYRQEA